MNRLPDRIQEFDSAESVDAEIVGLPKPPPSWWRRFLARAALAAVLGIIGAALCLIGMLLTITIVGAQFGIPIMILGAVLLLAFVFVFLGGGRIRALR